MRLPFLQVAQEEVARARTLAGYLSVPWQHAVGMVVALKAAALELAPEGDVSGAIADPNPAEWMAVQCGWPMDRANALAVALVRCGFAMAGPSGGHSVAGLEPYRAALETSKLRSEAGRRGAEARKTRGGYGRAMAGPQQSDGQGMARDAKTQTQTQTQKEETAPASSASEPARPAAQLSLVDSKLPQPESQPTPPPIPAKKRGHVPNAVSEWYEWSQAERKRLLGDDTPASSLQPHQWSRLGEAVKLHGQELLKVAHRLFLGDEYCRGQGFPTGLFVSRWEDWVGRAKAAGPAPKPAAEPVKWRTF